MMKTASDSRAHYHVWVGRAKTSNALLDLFPCNAIKYDGHVDHHNDDDRDLKFSMLQI